MTSFKILAALALLSTTAATPALSRTSQGLRQDYVRSGTDRAEPAGRTWCLHSFSQDEIDCYLYRSEPMRRNCLGRTWRM
jgi:hypothetical protein